MCLYNSLEIIKEILGYYKIYWGLRDVMVRERKFG